MHPRTIATLKELEDATWFVNVGRREPVSNTGFVSTRNEALKNSERESWEALCLEAANQYRERLVERDMPRFSRWNSIVEEVKKSTIPLVLRKTQCVVDANDLPQAFVHTVQWDILHVCMEAEYADVFPPDFYAVLAYWYAQGHFPCGWEGDFPKGKLLVY
jgi:hypothetical protein